MGGSSRPGSGRRAAALLATATVVVGVVSAGAAAPIVGTAQPAEAATGEQAPFLCTTEGQGLGQPLVDNDELRGTPVYPTAPDGTPDRSAAPLGWSERCQVAEQVEYHYRTTGGSLVPLAPGAVSLPADIAQLPVSDLVGADQMALGGATHIPYLIRVQRGTLPENRFLYSMAMLVPFSEYLANAGGAGPYDQSHWNGRLLFAFDGGVGIGHSQGELSTSSATLHEAMRLGHAVVYSSGTRTSNHYNLMLGGRTAVELKARFAADHGQPVYTVGIGGSGGGIQQYVYAQNHPGLIDAAIPLYSYPDMTTQTINIGDCELLEHYMDVTDGANPRWTDWDNRKIIQGQNTIEGFTSAWQARTGDTGSSECIEGWRGSTPLAMNPTFGLAAGMEDVLDPFIVSGTGDIADFPDMTRLLRIHADPSQWVEWTHWADVREVYGTDPDTGFAQVPWDNVGVQYGLRAVADGTLTPEEFLDLNANVGSWKEPEEATPESCGMVEAMAGAQVATLANALGLCQGSHLDQYSSDQMRLGIGGAPAPRRSADVAAITAAFESGLVFDGQLPQDIPIVDARHYLEHELDMHNAHQSFTVRERIRRAQGHADNHLVWFLDARPSIDDAATDQLFDDGFRLIDEWVLSMQATGLSAAEAKPAGAVDRCWNTDGSQIAAGDGVWSGAEELVATGEGAWTAAAPAEVDGVPVGACSAAFPLHSTSRIVAGGPITNDVYKCQLKPVAQSIADGDFGVWTPTADQQALLEEIHPDGVCDWSLRSVGYPDAPPPPSEPPPPSTPPPSTPTADGSPAGGAGAGSTGTDPTGAGGDGYDATPAATVRTAPRFTG